MCVSFLSERLSLIEPEGEDNPEVNDVALDQEETETASRDPPDPARELRSRIHSESAPIDNEPPRLRILYAARCLPSPLERHAVARPALSAEKQQDPNVAFGMTVAVGAPIVWLLADSTSR
jgi:hypothetical protein